MAKISVDGYAGRFLRVDLSNERVIEEKNDERTLRKYIGGTGLGIKFLYEEVLPGTHWSDPQNRLILAAGPLNGTTIGGSGSFSVVTKGPLTNGATSVQSNGFFGAFLKFCGFDGMIIQGVSERWVYLHINEDDVELHDATHLIGKDTYETEDLIKKEYSKKEREMSVASIGPAGEKLVKFAGIFADKGHAAAHNGPGAVMGSKKIKAIAISRGKTRIEVNDKAKLATIATRLLNDVRSLDRKTYDWGTLWAIPQSYEEHWLPVKNYTTNTWRIERDEFAEFQPAHIRKRFEGKPKPCWACQLNHLHTIRIPDGPYAGMVTEEPEYEQLASWSAQIGNTNVEGALMLSNLVDRLGMETNEASWVVGFVMECWERGLLCREDLCGLEMKWGDVEATKSLLNMIARREGFGSILAEGAMQAAKSVGGEATTLAIYTKKGSTPRGHDHRIRLWEMFDTCVSSTGTLEGPVLGAVGPQEWKEIPTALAKLKGQTQFEDSMVTCRFNTRNNIDLLSQAVNATTGWDLTWEEAICVGRRIVNLLKSFDIREGLTSDLDYPSARYGSSPADGPFKGRSIIPYWNAMLRNYYGAMGWDEETGKPLPDTLRKLGLEYVIKDIW